MVVLADLAQQAEQLTCNHQVTSSIPVVGTIQQESTLVMGCRQCTHSGKVISVLPCCDESP